MRARGRALNLHSGQDEEGKVLKQNLLKLHILKVLRGVALRRPPGGQGPLFARLPEAGSLSQGGGGRMPPPPDCRKLISRAAGGKKLSALFEKP